MDGLQCEFGSNGNIGFLKGKLMCNNEELLCACGKPASAAMIGVSAYKALCNDCHYGVDFPIQRIIMREAIK